MASPAVQDRTLGALDCMVMGQGPPLVLLPGLAPQNGRPAGLIRSAEISSMRTFASQFTTYLVGRPTKLVPGTSFAQMTATLAEALASEFEEPVRVLGISTGGSFAQQLAAEYPERVDRLVLLSTGCRLGVHGAISQQRMMTLAATRPPRYVHAAMMGELVPRWRGRIATSVAMYVAGPWLYPDSRQLADLIVTLAAEDRFDLRTLPTITAPTLILNGGRDQFYELGIVKETARLIPGSRLSVYPDRGHVTVVSDRQALAEAVAFLRA